jgi:hypothetical protein
MPRQEHVLQLQRGVDSTIDLALEIDREQHHCINVVRLGFGGCEAAIDEKAACPDLSRQEQPAAKSKRQTPASRAGRAEAERHVGFAGNVQPFGQITVGAEVGEHCS